MTSTRATLPRHPTLLAAGLLLCVLSLRDRPLLAQADKCGFVKAADVAALLGGPVVPTKPGNSCAWKLTGSNRRLLVLVYSNQIPGPMAFSGARQQAGTEGGDKVKDEAGIGDKAFSITASFGAAFIMLKQGRMLQTQFWTGAEGTEKDRDLLRIMVRKAVAAF